MFLNPYDLCRSSDNNCIIWNIMCHNSPGTDPCMFTDIMTSRHNNRTATYNSTFFNNDFCLYRIIRRLPISVIRMVVSFNDYPKGYSHIILNNHVPCVIDKTLFC